MILLDPGLDPKTRLRSRRISPRSTLGRGTVPRAERLPTPRTLTRFLTQAQDAVSLRGEVTVLLTTDETIRDLNQRFRGKNRPTDVLSFPAEKHARVQEKTAGDIAVSVDTARRQGTACDHSLRTELKILILHGLLHLAGYDHETDRGQMHRRERQLRARLGLPAGLIERTQRKPVTKRSAKP
jgi:probable rRNA maturation factor